MAELDGRSAPWGTRFIYEGADICTNYKQIQTPHPPKRGV